MNKLSMKSMSNQALKKKKKGFTLVELIIVIAIIAILAAIAIPKMGYVRTNANIKADIANAKNIHTAAASALIDEKIDKGKSYDLGTDTGKPIKDRIDAYSQSKAISGKDFVAVVDDNGNITITVDSKQAFPEQAEEFKTK
ncbi:prepilin-type N-terminal cleavage/methylation domain-containing protein [Clostridium uliginosum]|uniref:Type IV pilus assembly protein PilA n=1 Tax=Clostridium uliginosum TaxID=119641 RepID=A0A1I1PHG8_9CLOT|nr:prepilin-type N-terminal cleavage/methylation domain-containing protein [Clostridium uliginosum]SFD09251.1 type IV pilus assembly protein PilA [Clostridium uliginosum]